MSESLHKIWDFKSTPGIQRDGTSFAGDNYIDGQWCRWYDALPKKIGGYKKIAINTPPPLSLPHLVRGMYVAPNSPNFDIYVGTENTLRFLPIDSSANPLGGFTDRTPTGFIAGDPNTTWSFDRMFSTVDNGSILIAHAPPNLGQIDSPVRTPIWYGDLFANTPLVDTGFAVSGGICVLHPFLFGFGDAGQVLWTQANNPTVLLNEARVTGEKIIAMLPTRGGNSSPAGLMWSLTSVIRITQTGTNSIEFTFDVISDDSSILSSKSVVEYDGIYYWPGVNRFLVYTGIVQELPNTMSLDYFFSSLDISQRQKVWGTKITQWGEIWWHFPNRKLEGYNGECNDVIIYNLREKTWYDTTISRSSGFFDPTFSKPIWCDTDAPSTLWVHEVGTDQNVDNNLTPIPSWFESRVMSWTALAPSGTVTNIDRTIDVQRFEPDFKNQNGPMFLIINGRAYANSDPIQSSSLFISDMTTIISLMVTPIISELGEYVFYKDTLKVDCREQRRLLTVRIVSSSVGGDYHMGRPLLVGKIGDARP